MDIVKILTRKYPDSEWVLTGGEYEGLVWLADTPKPTEKELQALWAGVEFEFTCEQVERDRQFAYQMTSDPVFFEFQRGDKTEAEWLAAVQAVKTAHPYPTPPKK